MSRNSHHLKLRGRAGYVLLPLAVSLPLILIALPSCTDIGGLATDPADSEATDPVEQDLHSGDPEAGRPEDIPSGLDYDPRGEWRDWESGAPKGSYAGGPPGSYDSMPWNWNLPFRGCWRMTCGYGCSAYHQGQDVYATDWAVAGNPCGLEVCAPASGYVMFAGWKNGYGNTIIVEAGPSGLADGRRYIYRVAHLQSINVVPGWWVPRGYVLGRHGRTGNSTACHIHWAVYRGWYAGYGNVNGSGCQRKQES